MRDTARRTLRKCCKEGKCISDVLITIHYELYTGLPLISKWLTIESNSVSVTAARGSSGGVGGGVRAGFKLVEELNVNHQWAKQGYNWMEVSTTTL